jgi:acyl-coenzyme A synthetase/AMP-(fatty) acid ligase
MPNFAVDFLDTRPPGDPALITLDGSGERREWTFGQLSSASSSVAAMLVGRGVGRGQVVLTLMGNRIEYVLTLLACLRIGAVALPCTEQLRARDLSLRLERARPALIVFDERNRAVLEEAAPSAPTVAVPWSVPEAPAPPAADLSDTDPAFVLFTSGTSGKPKLVTHGQRYVWGQRVQAENWLGVRAGELFWSTAAPGWSKSTRNSFIAPWLGGAVALIQDRRFDAAERLQTIRSEGVNVLCMAPTEYRMIAADQSLAGLPSLRRIVAAGETPGAVVLEQWRSRTGLMIGDGYGQTETGHVAAVRPGEVPPPGSMGRPLPGVRAWIEDGELVLDPSSVPTFFLGYDGSPVPEGPWHTGDRVRQDADGYLFFESRADDVISSAGYRIGPEEIESVLDEHPAVRECAAIGVTDALRGEIVCAVVVLHADVRASDELARELQDFVRKRTAPYKHPRLVRFLDALPRTSTGKISRSVLRG